MEIKGLLLSVFIILTITGIIITVLFVEFGETEIKDIDCYDRYNNKINEVTCEEEVLTEDWQFMTGMAASGTIISFAAMSILFIDWLYD